MAKLYEHNGECHSITEWAKLLGIKTRTLNDRIRTMGAERALSSKAPISVRPLTLNGKTQSVAEWSRELGIDRQTILSRMRYGWSDERTLTEPVQLSRPRPMSHPWKRMTNLARENSIKMQRMPS